MSLQTREERIESERIYANGQRALGNMCTVNPASYADLLDMASKLLQVREWLTAEDNRIYSQPRRKEHRAIAEIINKTLSIIDGEVQEMSEKNWQHGITVEQSEYDRLKEAEETIKVWALAWAQEERMCLTRCPLLKKCKESRWCKEGAIEHATEWLAAYREHMAKEGKP